MTGTSWAFIGRKNELAALERAYHTGRALP